MNIITGLAAIIFGNSESDDAVSYGNSESDDAVSYNVILGAMPRKEKRGHQAIINAYLVALEPEKYNQGYDYCL